jgi:lantibiotic modifying enzyme
MFESLTKAPWDPARVRGAIAGIVEDADRRCRPKLLWPADEWDAWRSPRPLKTLYAGAAGVVWALGELRRRGVAETRLDLGRVAERALDAWRESPGVLRGLEQPVPAESSLMHGASGLLAVLWRERPEGAIADDLYELVDANVENESNDVFWGAPGTMLVARTMLARTSDPRWADVWRRSADVLWERRDEDGLWTQRLHGGEARSLTASHGLVGNALALLEGELAAERQAALVDGTIAALERTAVWEDGLVNWPTSAGRELAGTDGQIRLQWCAGAPGIVVAASDYLPDHLLLPAAELVWHAGPHGLEKGPNICHGTAGSGYALLKAFARTGAEAWLERARRFAVHALEQVQRLREQRGRGRYSLFTGDLGVAVYAADCLDGRASYPIYDSWE